MAVCGRLCLFGRDALACAHAHNSNTLATVTPLLSRSLTLAVYCIHAGVPPPGRGKNVNFNYSLFWPFWDYVFGTRWEDSKTNLKKLKEDAPESWEPGKVYT